MTGRGDAISQHTASHPRPGNHGTSTVVLFTTAFPLDTVGEVTFVRPELERLCSYFDRVVVVPAERGTVQCRLPQIDVEIDLSLARAIHPGGGGDRVRFLRDALSSGWFVQGLLRCPRLLLYPRALRRFAYCVAAALRTGDWLMSRLGDGGWGAESTLAYSYWLNYITAGVGRARRRFPALKVISRAHGADIYEDRYVPAHIPLHAQAIGAVDAVFCASEAGLRHLQDRYPPQRMKLSLAPLGSPDPGFRSVPSEDDCFRLVSCSVLEEVKRVDVLVSALATLGARMPDRAFEWCHLGGGPLRDRIERLCRDRMPDNVRWTVAGRLPPERVIAHYRDHPVDLFISTTASEGGRPVSMTEALSCGIPVVATAVGGVPELVFGDHGWLMPPHPTPEVVADHVGEIVNSGNLACHRDAARSYFEGYLRAEKLSDDFASRVRALI